jgi:hypothetical protein
LLDKARAFHEETNMLGRYTEKELSIEPATFKAWI